MIPFGASLPSRLWREMSSIPRRDTMLVCLELPAGMRFCALQGHRLLLRLGSQATEMPPGLRGGHWSGVSVQLMQRAQESDASYLMFSSDEAYSEVFTHFADDLFQALLDASGGSLQPGQVIGIVRTRLDLWSKFLAPSKGALDPRAALGVYAELAFAERYLLPILGPYAALSAWSGPEGEAQDFDLDFAYVDVKSLSSGVSTVTISSIDQLDPPSGRRVWLVAACRAQQGADSLHAIRDRLLQACEDHVPPRFRMNLAAAGLFGEEDFDGLGIDSWSFYDSAVPAFPRILRGGVPVGVVKMTYVIDLSSAEAVAEAGFMRMLGLSAKEGVE